MTVGIAGGTGDKQVANSTDEVSTLDASVAEVLAAAVAQVAGQERPGQSQMAQAVMHALNAEQHLLVQAGTGTGKSLGYLVPAVLHPERVVVATATLNLQHQLLERDVPALRKAMTAANRMPPKVAVVKGRRNYACLRKVRDGAAEQDDLFDDEIGKLGAQVLELREWAEEASASKGSGDREDAPSHTDSSWRQVSVSARECVGASRCAFGAECFAELAREDANTASLPQFANPKTQVPRRQRQKVVSLCGGFPEINRGLAQTTKSGRASGC